MRLFDLFEQHLTEGFYYEAPEGFLSRHQLIDFYKVRMKDISLEDCFEIFDRIVSGTYNSVMTDIIRRHLGHMSPQEKKEYFDKWIPTQVEKEYVRGVLEPYTKVRADRVDWHETAGHLYKIHPITYLQENIYELETLLTAKLKNTKTTILVQICKELLHCFYGGDEYDEEYEDEMYPPFNCEAEIRKATNDIDRKILTDDILELVLLSNTGLREYIDEVSQVIFKYTGIKVVGKEDPDYDDRDADYYAGLDYHPISTLKESTNELLPAEMMDEILYEKLDSVSVNKTISACKKLIDLYWGLNGRSQYELPLYSEKALDDYEHGMHLDIDALRHDMVMIVLARSNKEDTDKALDILYKETGIKLVGEIGSRNGKEYIYYSVHPITDLKL